jgi:RNA polymerase sigma-70 factor (ECF subfamily)
MALTTALAVIQSDVSFPLNPSGCSPFTRSHRRAAGVNEHELNSRLSRISTEWTVVFRATVPGSEESSAQQALLQRYCGAIYRYLLAALQDPESADDAAQEFALCFVRGELRRADPGKGRFRDFVKTALDPLIAEYRKRQRKGAAAAARPTPSPEEQATLDRTFTTSWREELMTRAWESLARLQETSGQPLHAALRLRAERPELHSEALAGELGKRLGRPVTAGEVRRAVHTAREKFAEFLVTEVAHSLESSDPKRLVQELIDLGLTDYCRPALEKSA